MTRSERATAMMEAGSSCAQAVFTVFAKDLGLDEEVAHRLANGLGGGFGRKQYICGAVSGAVLALGLAMGSATSGDQASKEAAYAATVDLIDWVETEEGASDCRKLLGGVDLRTPEGKAALKERDLSASVCRPLAAKIVERVEKKLGLAPA